MTTGSYEGSLATEGIPDRIAALPSRGAMAERSRRSFGLPTRANPCHLQGRAAKQQLPRRRERRKAQQGSRQGCQRLGRTRLRGKTTPTLMHPKRKRRKVHGTCVVRRPAEAVSGVVKRLVPRSSTRRSQSLRGVSTLRKGRKEPGTREVRVHVIRLDGRYRFVASRVFTAGRSQGRSVARGR